MKPQNKIEISNERDCYCKERINPKMREYFSHIPNGYCGFCDICNEPSHMMTHPRSATTGCWCDEHYEELVSYKIFGLNDIISIAMPILAVVSITLVVIYFA